MDFEVQILGSNSAMSSHGRHPSSQLLKIHQHSFLIDCGEGTQFQLQKFKCKPFRISCIFISHLHGDHYFGLIGLLTTFQLLRRESKLTIIGPAQLEEIINLQLSVSNSVLTYPLEFIATDANKVEVIYENNEVVVTSIPLKHRIPCTGFLFREKLRPRKIHPENIKNFRLSPQGYDDLRNGLDAYDLSGQFHKNEELTLQGDVPRAYAYCTDTIFLPSIIPIIKGVNLLYHESTFIGEAIEKAQDTYHSTTFQAATIALEAQVGELIIGHFSSKYADLSILLDECKTIFKPSSLAIEGEVFKVKKLHTTS
ncbi:MAG TPA: ribonuclease Z [Chitinophagales bacterium]|nr:ribonuclease Z [Chitinophagales bacterium]